MKSKNYKSKVALPIEGALVLRCKVTSKAGSSLETGRASAFSMKEKGVTKFLISKCITQVKFGHLESLGLDWTRFYQSSGAVSKSDTISVIILSSHYEYRKYNDDRKYKSINFKGKRYVQVFEKNYNNRFVFKGRYKAKYHKTKNISKIKEEFEL